MILEMSLNPLSDESIFDQAPVPFKLAIVGCGKLVSEQFVPALASVPGLQLAGLVDARLEAAQLLSARWSSSRVPCATSLAQLLDTGVDIDCVLIATPNCNHVEDVLLCAQHGLHVLCEKPLSSSVLDSVGMIRACREAGVKLMVGYRLQYTDVYWHAHAACAGGALGSIKMMQAMNGQVERDHSAWRLDHARAGGGALVDIGVYGINGMRFLLGEEPEWVSAVDQRSAHGWSVEEGLALTMGFPSGAIGQVCCSYASKVANSLRIYGDQGRLSLDPGFVYRGLSLSVGNRQGETQLNALSHDQFARELLHFEKSLRLGITPWTPGEEGLLDQLVMDAAYKSALAGGERTWVRRIEEFDLSMPAVRLKPGFGPLSDDA